MPDIVHVTYAQTNSLGMQVDLWVRNLIETKNSIVALLANKLLES